MADKMKQVVEEAKKDAVKVVGEVKEQVRPAVEKATETAVRATRKTAEKAAKAKNAVERAARKAVTGEAAPVVYVQYMGSEKKVEDLVAAAKAAFAHEHPRTKVTDLRLYIKPEERAAYYVVNEKFAGRVGF